MIVVWFVLASLGTLPWVALIAWMRWRHVGGLREEANSQQRAAWWGMVSSAITDGHLALVYGLLLYEASVGYEVLHKGMREPDGVAIAVLVGLMTLRIVLGIFVYLLVTHWGVIVLAIFQALATQPSVAFVDAKGTVHEWSPITANRLRGSIIMVGLLTLPLPVAIALAFLL